MYKKIITISTLIFSFITATAQLNSVELFDNDWRFFLGGAQGASLTNFNDSTWRILDLPHDWSIEDRHGTQSPFNPSVISQVCGGFTFGGTGWYRKRFSLPAAQKGRRVSVQFDGVYMNADVWVNGEHLGSHPYGYTSFCYDITAQVKFGAPNLIVVEVKNEGVNSRWYSGSGIYRHVWLKTFSPVHIAQWGTNIATPEVSGDNATVTAKTTVLNETEKVTATRLVNKIISTAGVEVARTESAQVIDPGKSVEYAQQARIANPQLWSCELPAIYILVTELYIDGTLVETEKMNFGIRRISFDAVNGFQLNGKTIKLKGGCFHIDNGPLGTKAFDRAEQRKVALLKEAGFNAIRCSHNPPSPAFLAACDRLGMLVIDEAFDCWNIGKTPFDYHLYFKDWWKKDIENMVMRDRNHPSIIMWSIGNEIPEQHSAEGVKTAKLLADYILGLDPTRGITDAVNGITSNMDPFFAQLNVAGYNYAVMDAASKSTVYDEDHARVPGRVMMGTESYPLESFGSWMSVMDHPYIIGDFVWTAFDYIGEASIGWLGYPQYGSFYPWNLAFCGDIDICGWKRPQSFYRDALWKKDQLSIFVKPPKSSFDANPDLAEWSKWNWLDAVAEWNWDGFENKLLDVSVYSSCDKVELLLNNKSLGIKPTNRLTEFMAVWAVPYSAGELKAVGYTKNRKVNTTLLRTAGQPVKIELSADRTVLNASGQDLSYITVTVTDANGNINPGLEKLIHFDIEGSGEIAGVGNANPMSIESNRRPERKTWKGRCMVIVKSTHGAGKISLKASGEGLASTLISLTSEHSPE